MRLSYTDVVCAVNSVFGWRDGIEKGSFEIHLVRILEEYKDKGRFKGTIESALDCLEQEGYDVVAIRKSTELD